MTRDHRERQRPGPDAAIPAQGATAAAPITFTCQAASIMLDADMIWPDPTNSDNNILTFLLTDPAGKLAQMSYDYGGLQREQPKS